MYGFSVLVGVDAVNVMAAYCPVVQAYFCTTGEYDECILILIEENRIVTYQN
jgi:uncharacterized protein YuzE